jgi:hypothetical protein
MECRAGAARGRAQSVSIALVAALAGCGSPAERAPAAPAALPGARFVEITRETGLSFDFDRARHDDYFMPDSMAAGCALFDYDGDDDLDVYIVNGYQQDGVWVGPEGADRLLRQEPDGRFTDVTAQAGVGDPGYGMGVAVGDIDNDGDLDLFVTNYGPDTLYRNDGDGTFTDVRVEAGVGDPRWGASAGFFDYDADGFLDLFVSNYLEYDPALRAADTAGRPEYPGPQCCPGAPDSLFRNRGDGTFEDVTRAAGLYRFMPAMGLNFGDLDDDGWLDIYLGTGDPDLTALVPNRMLRNAEGRSFQDVTTAGNFGHLQKGHAIAFGDVDGDGDLDVFAQMGGAFADDKAYSTLYRNPGHGNRFVVLELEGVRSNHRAVGARIKLTLDTPKGPRVLHRTVTSGGSFGGSPFRQHIGLGDARRIAAVEIYWPATGRTEHRPGLAMGRRHLLREGGGG